MCRAVLCPGIWRGHWICVCVQGGCAQYTPRHRRQLVVCCAAPRDPRTRGYCHVRRQTCSIFSCMYKCLYVVQFAYSVCILATSARHHLISTFSVIALLPRIHRGCRTAWNLEPAVKAKALVTDGGVFHCRGGMHAHLVDVAAKWDQRREGMMSTRKRQADGSVPQ